MGRIELGRRCLCLYPDAAWIEPDRIGSDRHDGHIGNARLRKCAIGAEEVGHLRALVQSENCDGRPLALGWLQGLDRLLVLGGRHAIRRNRRNGFIAHRQKDRDAAGGKHRGRSNTNAKGSSAHGASFAAPTMPRSRHAVATEDAQFLPIRFVSRCAPCTKPARSATT